MTGTGITALLAERAARGVEGFDDAGARRLVGQCLLDWTACAVAGITERPSRIATALAHDERAAGTATIVGAAIATSAMLAARANGVISHAIDFDDANLAMPGHPGVVLFPALLAFTESRRSTGRAFTDAFLAGYDVGCRTGRLVAPSHYARGFHATGTIGTFAAAGACGRLLGLDASGMRRAIGLAATQAAGLIGMFGSDAKPLHAGNASANGLASALLAARGMSAREDALECPQGFVATHSDGLAVDAALAAPQYGAHHVFGNLFKVHAACYGTHATIECALALRQQPAFRVDAIRTVRIDVGEECTRTCDIEQPATGAEARFSLRFNAAAALLGLPTHDAATYSADTVGDRRIAALRDKVTPRFVPGRSLTRTDMRVDFADGTQLTASADTSVPNRDLDRQEALLLDKFRNLVAGRIATPLAGAIARQALAIDTLDDVGAFMGLLRFDGDVRP